MNPSLHRQLLVLFLALTALVWIIWGLYCLFVPQAWSGEVIPGMEIFNLDGSAARTEVRAMYGGLQCAIGLFAVIAILKQQHRDTALLFFVLLFSGLALSRLSGIIIEGNSPWLVFSTTVTPERYNSIGLAMYELPSMLAAWILFLMKP